MKNNLFSSVIVIFLLFSCKNKPMIDGLWIVTSVKAGEQEMTPNARWTRFNSDFTQQSGNGWFQHSFGTWNFDHTSNTLSIINSNGLEDTSGPFKITVRKNTMLWKRQEDGQSVEITLERSNTLPKTYGDKLIGLWQLEEFIGNDSYFKKSDDTNSNNYIFFKWDKKFFINSKRGRIHGVYNVNGHRPELELIPYKKELNRNFWKIEYSKNAIALRLLNTDSTVIRKFKKIRKFPQ